jgi:hypothetical protein
MSRYRVTGIHCDSTKCEEKVELFSRFGPLFADLYDHARDCGWLANSRRQLCPKHRVEENAKSATDDDEPPF